MVSKSILIILFPIFCTLLLILHPISTINFVSKNVEATYQYYGSNLIFNLDKVLAQETHWSEYIDNSTHIITIIPSNWEIINDRKENNNQNTNITILRSPKENVSDLFQENIVISVIDSKFNLTDSKDVNIQDVIKKLGIENNEFDFENSSTIKIKNDVDNNNKTAQSITYSFSNLGILFKTEQIFMIENSNLYIFSLLAEYRSFDKYKMLLDQILSNIVFTDQ